MATSYPLKHSEIVLCFNTSYCTPSHISYRKLTIGNSFKNTYLHCIVFTMSPFKNSDNF